MDYNGTAATDRIRIYNNAGSFQFLTENGNQKLSIDKTTGNATFAGNITVPNTSTIAGATIRSSGINASNSHLQLGNAFPWIDLVAPDGAYFKAGITARGGASSTQGQFHLHIARDSSYKKLSSAGNYDTYLVTETANTVYGNLILGTDLTEAIRILASNQNVGIGEPSPSGKLSIKSSGTSTYPFWIKHSDGSNAFMMYEHGSGEIEIDLRSADGSSPKFKINETGISSEVAVF